jgi:hypothetical protein
MMRNATISAIFLFATTSFATATGDLPVNPDVTPENIDETICVKGYSSSIRPPQVYTDRVKRHLMREAGLPLDTIGDYILDHRINIAIGGSPTSLHNLQLEDRFESFEKDRAENRAHSLVCTHRLSLREAQAIMYSDWRRLLPAR